MTSTSQPSDELRDLVTQLRSAPRRTGLSVDDLRTQSAAAFSTGDIDDVELERLSIRGVPAEWVRHQGSTRDRVVLWVRGGGFCIGGIPGRRLVAAEVSRLAGASVLVIDYALAPERPFPAGLDDVLDSYTWLLETGVDPTKLAVIGDSSGANLVIGALVEARDRGLALPDAMVALSPWVDLALHSESLVSNSASDPLITAAGLRGFVGNYLQGADPRDPRVSPVYASLHGLPRLLVQVGSTEVLLDDARRLADRARQDGVSVTLEVWEGALHVWHLYATLPERQQALECIAQFLKGTHEE